MCDKDECLCKSCIRHCINGEACGSCCDAALWLLECRYKGVKKCGNYRNIKSIPSRLINFISNIFKGGK